MRSADSFADRLERLLSRRNPQTGRRYSDAEVAAAVGLSKTQVWALRTGQATNPTRETIANLADFFGVPAGYFFGDDSDADDPELRAALADAGVRNIAARSIGLSPQSREMILTVLDQIRRLEQQDNPMAGG